MTTLPLDVGDLLGVLDDPRSEPFDGLAGGTVMGHVHLRVAEIPATTAFYCDALGFGLMAAFGAQASFMSAGGYHHHLGANTWESRGAGRPPPGHATLEQVTIVLPDGGGRRRGWRTRRRRSARSRSGATTASSSATPRATRCC